MSLAEIKQHVDKLTPEEKAELWRYLQNGAEEALAARRARVSATMREMDAGRKYSAADLERIDRELNQRAS